jgi:hypothetical protein
LVWCGCATPVSTLITITFAPAIAADEESVTLPKIIPLLSCAGNEIAWSSINRKAAWNVRWNIVASKFKFRLAASAARWFTDTRAAKLRFSSQRAKKFPEPVGKNALEWLFLF